MFLGRKNQYCENDYTTKHNLQFQCDPYQVSMAFFTELEQNDNENVTTQNLWDASKAVLREKFTATQSYFEKQ